MGHAHIDTLKEFASATSQERVGEDVETGKRDVTSENYGAVAEAHPAPVISDRKETYAEIVKKSEMRTIGPIVLISLLRNNPIVLVI
jgi:hypothetical protein